MRDTNMNGGHGSVLKMSARVRGFPHPYYRAYLLQKGRHSLRSCAGLQPITEITGKRPFHKRYQAIRYHGRAIKDHGLPVQPYTSAGPAVTQTPAPPTAYLPPIGWQVDG